MQHRLIRPLPFAALMLVAIASFNTACGRRDAGSSSFLGTPPSSSQSSAGGEARGGVAEPPLGATPKTGGVTFRAWAPNVRRLSVAGDFNGWDTNLNEMTSDGDGNWSAFVEGASPWQKYRFYVTGQDWRNTWRTDPRARRVESSDGAGIIHDPNTYWWANDFRLPAWSELVAYEMHIGTFAGSGYGHVGNFRAAMGQLDYLKDLGINLLEVMPSAEFRGDSSWGYNPAFPFAPESAYGTPEDFKAFIDAAHGRGIGVILDVVHNHYGPDDLSMWCFTGECLGGGGFYFYSDWRAQTPWGATRPDFGRAEVRNFIADNARMWLTEYRLDGLRWDATHYIRSIDGDQTPLPDGIETLRAVNAEIERDQPWKINVAEDMAQDDAITRRTSEGGLGFGAQWDGDFVHTVRDAATTARDEDRSMAALRDALAHSFDGEAMRRFIYSESHDESANGHQRLNDEIAPGAGDNWYARKRSTLAASLVLTAPGIPMLFQGQEFLESGYFDDNRPLDWSKASRNQGVRALYQDLIKLRRDWFDTTRGLRGDAVNVFHVNDRDKVIAYHRWQNGGAGDDVVVLANFSARSFPAYSIGMPRAGLWHVRFNGDSTKYSGDFANTASFDFWTTPGPADGMAQSGTIGIGPYSVVILSQ